MAKRRMSLEGSCVAVVGNEDLLREIFMRVPAKLLVRFKRVSKNWLDLISDPKFAADHTRRNFAISVSGLYIINSASYEIKPAGSLRDEACLLEFFTSKGTKLPIIDSCNGLMLLGSFSTPYIVCNPTTGVYKILPKLAKKLTCGKSYKVGECLAFDPSKSTHYKVLKIVFVTCHHHYEINIFNSESKGWKTVCVAATYISTELWYQCLGYVNGAIHWICNENIHSQFDLDKETYLKTESPTEMYECDALYVGKCAGRLLVVHISWNEEEGFHILVMERVKSTWILKKKLSSEPLKEALGVMLFFECLQGGGKREDEVAVLVSSHSRIYMYNMMTENLEVLQDHTTDSDRVCPLLAFSFTETLSPV